MRIDHLLCATVLLSPAAIAQNGFDFWPGVTNFTSRGSIGNNPGGGELHQGLHTSAVTGLGDNGGTQGQINAFRLLLQDQNTSTQETYHFVIRKGTDTDGPDSNAAGRIGYVGPLTSPPKGTGGTLQAWYVTHSFGTTVPLELCQMNTIGIELQKPPGSGWPADGLSCHMSRGDASHALSVQSAAAGAPDMAWQIINFKVDHPSLHRSWLFAIQTSSATLQMGNGGSKYGQGGPNPAAGVALSSRVSFGSAMAGGTSLFFLATAQNCPGFSISKGARVHLAGIIKGPFPLAIDAGGKVVYALGTTPTTPLNLTLHFQAAGLKSGTVKITNLCTTRL